MARASFKFLIGGITINFKDMRLEMIRISLKSMLSLVLAKMLGLGNFSNDMGLQLSWIAPFYFFMRMTSSRK